MALYSPSRVTAFLLLFFIFSLGVGADEKKQENELTDLLQGFEEETSKAKDNALDELISGFEDSSTETQQITENQALKKWDFSTLLSFSSSINYQKPAPSSGNPDYRGLSRLKFKIQPEFRYKFNSKWDALISASGFYDAIYRIKGRSEYNQDTLDSYESELELREIYLRGVITDNFDIKLGRQIVVWGKSDSIRVVDVLNPLDFREPGMVDIEDLRLPVTMLKADYYFSDWNLSAIVIPEIRFNKIPTYGGDFSLSDSPAPHEEKPDHVTDSEFALALSGIFNGWDLSFHTARYYDDQAHLIIPAANPAQGIQQKHSHLTMLGMSTNVALGNWLLKMESAYIDGLEYTNSNQSFSRMDIMLGVDYAGISDSTFSVEIANRHINDYTSELKLAPDQTKENEQQVALRYTGNFMREKLQIVGLVSMFGTDFDSGSFYRASAEYEIMDAMSIMLGGIVYHSGDNFLINRIARNDRLFTDLRYSF